MTVLRIATFNVLFGYPGDGPSSWLGRRTLLRRAIEATRADVLGFQEVFPSKLTDLAELTTPLALVPGPSTGPPRIDASSTVEALAQLVRTRRLSEARAIRRRSERMHAGEHQPIGYRAERFALLASGSFWISATPARPGSTLPLAPSPFMVHWARLAAHDGSVALLVMNGHFGHAPWHHGPTARIVAAQTAALSAPTIAEVPTAGITPSLFLVGDFNALPSSPLLRRLTSPAAGGFVDAARSASERTGPPATYHWGKGATRLGLTLDYVLARTSLQPRRAEVVDVHEGSRYPSDHHPLVVEFGTEA
jgi:endonuclease/exonuclease/phosphatase family metal-dependent hydrolase